jgi:DNA polymerase elongation subunit (family B)
MMDTHLAWRLASVRKYLENAAEAANITYTALPRQIKGGQSERIMATIIAKVRTDGAPFLFPFYRPPNLTKEEKRRRKKAFKGAAVLPMHCEFICDAVPVGDYAGLYPSIMIYYNLCYTTYVAPDRLEAVRAHHRATYGRDGLHQSPAGHWFVDADIRVGLVPAQLRIVLAARSAAKKQNAAEAAIVRQYRVSAKWVEAADWRAALAEAAAAGGDVRDAFKTPEAAAAFVEAALAAAAASGVDAGVHWARELAEHDALAAAYDAKQAALKVLANSMYGFTGAEIGKLPCTPVSESVTSYGRAMIMRIKDMAERRNPETGRYCCDPDSPDPAHRAGLTAYRTEVIYGDTDSAFVRLHGCGDMREATAFNEAMCSMITASFGDASVRLEAEKVLAEWLGFGPKRYCTLQFELTRAGEGIVRVNAKGFELVRRDTCRVLQQVLETCVAYVFPHGDRAGLPPDIPAAVAYVREVIAKMFRGEIAVADYAITKGVKCAPEAYLSVPAHITFAMRRREKYGDAAPPVEMGTRLVYVMVDRVGAIPAEKAQTAKAKGAAVDMADYMEDVGHAAAHPDTTPIAVGWYLEKQFRKPFSRFFASLLFSDPQMPKEVRRERAWSHLFNDPELQRALAQAQQRRGQLARQSGPMARFLTSTPAAPVRRAAPAAPAAPAPAAATPKRGKTIAEYFARK